VTVGNFFDFLICTTQESSGRDAVNFVLRKGCFWAKAATGFYPFGWLLAFGPVWHSLFYSFFTEISSNYTKQQTSAQLINSAASQNELKADNKHKLFFNSISDKLLFQQAVVVPNRAFGFLEAKAAAKSPTKQALNLWKRFSDTEKENKVGYKTSIQSWVSHLEYQEVTKK
jgi:hypothetical protein